MELLPVEINNSDTLYQFKQSLKKCFTKYDNIHCHKVAPYYGSLTYYVDDRTSLFSHSLYYYYYYYYSITIVIIIKSTTPILFCNAHHWKTRGNPDVIIYQ